MIYYNGKKIPVTRAVALMECAGLSREDIATYVSNAEFADVSDQPRQRGGRFGFKPTKAKPFPAPTSDPNVSTILPSVIGKIPDADLAIDRHALADALLDAGRTAEADVVRKHPAIVIDGHFYSSDPGAQSLVGYPTDIMHQNWAIRLTINGKTLVKTFKQRNSPLGCQIANSLWQHHWQNSGRTPAPRVSALTPEHEIFLKRGVFANAKVGKNADEPMPYRHGLVSNMFNGESDRRARKTFDFKLGDYMINDDVANRLVNAGFISDYNPASAARPASLAHTHIPFRIVRVLAPTQAVRDEWRRILDAEGRRHPGIPADEKGQPLHYLPRVDVDGMIRNTNVPDWMEKEEQFGGVGHMEYDPFEKGRLVVSGIGYPSAEHLRQARTRLQGRYRS